jgi:hypothetical protein
MVIAIAMVMVIMAITVTMATMVIMVATITHAVLIMPSMLQIQWFLIRNKCKKVTHPPK